MHELKVAVDLLSRGLNVFHPFTNDCGCDFAVQNGDKLIRVEVTTAYLLPTGRKHFSRHDPSKFDLLALVFPHHIEYVPPLDQIIDPENQKPRL
jgi:hypothetical protein